MPKRNLRIVKRTPIAIGICESCNMQFESHQPIEDDAEAEMRAAFDAHKCKREDINQAAARIVREHRGSVQILSQTGISFLENPKLPFL